MTLVREIVEVECDNCRCRAPVDLPAGHVLFVELPAGWVRRHWPLHRGTVVWSKGPLLDLCPACNEKLTVTCRRLERGTS